MAGERKGYVEYAGKARDLQDALDTALSRLNNRTR